jgi:DNA-binding NtrC family response regulator
MSLQCLKLHEPRVAKAQHNSHKDCAVHSPCAGHLPKVHSAHTPRGCTMYMQDSTILIADDDSYVRDDLVDLLANQGCTLLQSSTAKETWEVIEREHPDLVLLDIKFPDAEDLTLLDRITKLSDRPQVIILTSQTDNLKQVVAAIKAGAFDYVGKPFNDDELKNRIEKALEIRRLSNSQRYFLKELETSSGLARIIGTSHQMLETRESVKRVADADGCILIGGESGTGKELVARAIHSFGKRRSKPFIAINCASIPEALVESTFFGHKRGAFTGAVDSTKGRFEWAEDGTIFLDEIGDMPLAA